MIGNDIISLAAGRHHPRSTNPRWLEKAFTRLEQQRITESADGETHLWLHWAMKESAWKAWNRHADERTFAPKRVVVEALEQDGSTVCGTVSIGDSLFYATAHVAADHIHCVASADLTATLVWATRELAGSGYDEQASTARTLAHELLETHTTQMNWTLCAQQGKPVARHASGATLAVSYSHHGHFAACAIETNTHFWQ